MGAPPERDPGAAGRGADERLEDVRESCASTCGLVARPADRLSPARDQAELPARVPPGADGGGTPQLDARLGPRGPAAALELARARHGELALQSSPACAGAVARRAAPRLLGARPEQRPAAGRGAVPRRRPATLPAGGRVRRELGSHGRQGSHLSPLRPVRRPERRHARRPRALPRNRRRAHRSHRLAADGRLPRAALARGVRRPPPPLRPRSRPGRSCSSWATRRRTRPTSTASSTASSGGGRSTHARASSCSSVRIPAIASGRSGSAGRSDARAFTSRSRATRT